jgi:hypothetical protein
MEESEAAVYAHDPDAADEVAAELCDELWDMVAFVLQPSTVWELRWSAAGFPTIMDVQVLAPSARVQGRGAGIAHHSSSLAGGSSERCSAGSRLRMA